MPHTDDCEYSCRYPCTCNGQNRRSYLQKCRCDLPSGRRPSADDLLVLLAVGRSGRYTTAAEELGLNHTTISRRIAALEQSIGGRVLARVGGGWELTDLGREALSAAEAVESAVRSLTVDPGGERALEGVVRISATDGFSAYIAAPAAAEVQRKHPERGGRDRRHDPARHPAAVRPGRRGGGRRTAGAPRQGDPARRLLPRALRVARLPGRTRHPDEHRRSRAAIRWSTSSTRCCRSTTSTWRRSFAPAMRESVTSTNVFVHVEATRAAAGLGLLPCFMADRHDDLVRVLPDAVAIQLTYWLVTRAETLRRPGGRRGRGRDPRPDGRSARRAARRCPTLSESLAEPRPGAVGACHLSTLTRPRLLPALGRRRAARRGHLPARLRRAHRRLSPLRLRAQRRGHRPVGGRPVRPRAQPGHPRRLRLDRGQLRPRRHADRAGRGRTARDCR